MACLESDYSMFQEESDFESDCSFMSDEDEENVAPPSKGSKPAPGYVRRKAFVSVGNSRLNSCRLPIRL